MYSGNISQINVTIDEKEDVVSDILYCVDCRFIQYRQLLTDQSVSNSWDHFLFLGKKSEAHQEKSRGTGNEY